MLPRIVYIGSVFSELTQASFYLERRWLDNGKYHLVSACTLLIEYGDEKMSRVLLDFFETHYPNVDFSDVHEELLHKGDQ